MDSYLPESSFTSNITSYLANMTITGNKQIDSFVTLQLVLQLTSIIATLVGSVTFIIPLILKSPTYLPYIFQYFITRNYIIIEIEYGKMYNLMNAFLKITTLKEKTQISNTIYLLNFVNSFDWINNLTYIKKNVKSSFNEKDSYVLPCYVSKKITFEDISITIEYDINSISYSNDTTKPMYIYFNYWYCNKEYINRFFKYIKTELNSSDKSDKSQLIIRYAKVFKDDDYVEYTKKSTLKRRLESVYLKKEIKDKLFDDIQKFQNMESFYKEHSISYKRGYLLYGPPGTGKTSIIKAIASHFDYDIYIINLNNFNDSNINNIFNDMNDDKTKIYLFDDFDGCSLFEEKSHDIILNTSSTKKESNNGKLTYTGFINALSGISDCVNGSFMFFTTNNLDKIPKSMLRPQRIDMVLEIGYAERSQFEEMVKDFYKDVDQEKLTILVDKLSTNDKQLTIAVIQDFFIRFRDIDDAITHIVELM